MAEERSNPVQKHRKWGWINSGTETWEGMGLRRGQVGHRNTGGNGDRSSRIPKHGREWGQVKSDTDTREGMGTGQVGYRHKCGNGDRIRVEDKAGTNSKIGSWIATDERSRGTGTRNGVKTEKMTGRKS